MKTLINEIPDEDNNTFVSLRELLRSSDNFVERKRVASVATLATAIEKTGIYTWDKYGRYKHFEMLAAEAQVALGLLANIYKFEQDDERRPDQHPLDAKAGDPYDPYSSFGWATEVLPDFVAILASQPEISKQKLSSNAKVESNNLSIIAALLAYIKGEMKGIKKHPSYTSDATLIAEIEAEYSIQVQGLSKRTLEDKFAKAKRILK